MMVYILVQIFCGIKMLARRKSPQEGFHKKQQHKAQGELQADCLTECGTCKRPARERALLQASGWFGQKERLQL